MKIPILILAYNRKDKTRQLLEKIKKYKPTKLYISIDGPKLKDLSQINEVINLIDKLVDWDCEIFKRSINTNLGTHYGIETAIDWFFSKEKMGIILEDDCIPTESFFEFMELTLVKFQNDESIMSVSGHNCGVTLNNNFYYSSTLPMTWGWGTWARAWAHYDKSLKNVYTNKVNYIKKILASSGNRYEYVVKRLIELDLINQDKVAAWDYRWFAAVNCNEGETIFPPINLIKNIGFDESATHTKNSNSPIANLHTDELIIPVKEMKLDKTHSNVFWDKYLLDRMSKRSLQNYVLKKVLLTMSLQLNGTFKEVYILGNKELGKKIYSNLSSNYQISGFCGKDILCENVDRMIRNQIADKNVLIVSSIEGPHEEEVLSDYRKYFTTCSWRELLTGNKDVDDYINNNFLRWVNNGVFNN